MKKFIYSALIGLLILGACKKKVDDGSGVVLKTDNSISPEMKKISAYPWVVYKVMLAGFDAFDQMNDCQKDDTYLFRKDSILVQYDNKLKCNGGMDSVLTSWEFLEDRTKVFASVLGVSDTATIVTLQDNDMRLEVDYFGTPATIYFKKP